MLSEEERNILNSIVIHSENDPSKPEFPYDDPKFPATPSYQIQVDGFTNIWLKDESYNTSGTHKDRMAWEIVVTYREFLLAKERWNSIWPLPQFSIISSGSAAYAIQLLLKKFKLPNLKILIDLTIDKRVVEIFKDIGCEVYTTDLSLKELNTEDILRLTKNQHGFDITSSEAFDPSTRFYDWLSYEILNTNPEYCFIPFGSGHLYENILNRSKQELSSPHRDPRFQWDIAMLRKCHFFWAHTIDPKSKAEKIYSPYLPFGHISEQWLNVYKLSGYCGSRSGIYNFDERYLYDAIDIAKANSITCEPSGIVGLALLLQMQDTIPKNAKILIVNTGRSKYLDMI